MSEEKFDVIRITKADGCVWEYRVQDLRLEYIGVPLDHRVDGEPMGSLEISAETVLDIKQCSAEESAPPRPLNPPLDHITLRVRTVSDSRSFYEGVLGGMGYEVLVEFPGCCALGRNGLPSLWLAEAEDGQAGHAHFCLRAQAASEVDEFHRRGLQAEAESLGAPGYRSHYHPGFYAAYLKDPDGTNLGVVFHDPQKAPGRGDPS